jgi:hypothetical protein
LELWAGTDKTASLEDQVLSLLRLHATVAIHFCDERFRLDATCSRKKVFSYNIFSGSKPTDLDLTAVSVAA